MDIDKIFVGLAITLVGVISVASYLNFMNDSYGTDAGSTFNETLVTVQTITQSNIEEISLQVGNNTIPQSGASPSDQQEGLISRSWGTLNKLTDLLGLIPALFGYGAEMLGIPEEYQDIAKWLFVVLFGLAIAYILLLGVKRWFGL